MKTLKFYIVFLVLCAITAHPLGKLDTEPELKNEKKYPNGTVIGKYVYKDKEGNPVHIKYYADDSSYGVELKSVKVIDSKSPLTTYMSNDNSIKVKDMDMDTTNNYINTDFEFLNQKIKQKLDRKPEFEIFTENYVRPEKCGNGKIKLYYDKNHKRRIRNLVPYETPKHCQRL